MINNPTSNYRQLQRHTNSSLSASKLNLRVLEIDRQSLMSALREQTPSRQHGGWIGKCPYCATSDKSKKKQAYLTPRETGYVFHCCSCGVNQTVFNFLTATQGDSRAQDYAQARWDAGQLCGQGWNCPLPSKDYRREAYRRADQERKARNYQKKYGSSPAESR